MVKPLNSVNVFVDKRILTESLKAEVYSEKVKFPTELGIEHPFSFKDAEETYKKVGIVKALIDKHIDFIISPSFYVTSIDKKAETLIKKFIQDNSLEVILRQWILESLIKGNGFLEIAVGKKDIEIKIINANNMYVDRDKKGNILGYNQYVGGFDKFNIKKIVPFDVDEIAHLQINTVGDDAYGIGLIYSAMKTIDNLLKSEKDQHMLVNRKANSPIHAKLGSFEEPVSSQAVTDFGTTLEYLNNMHEWATDHKVEFKVIDFGNIGDKFNAILEHDTNFLFYIFQVPAVIMGMANIPEGLAKSQSDAWERRIQSLQSNIEKVVEEKIFRPILNMNGLDAHVELEWGKPNETQINERLQKLTLLMQNPLISPQLRAMLEIDTAASLGYDEYLEQLPKPEMMPEIERETEQEIKQPEIPGEKPNAKEKIIKEVWDWDKQNEQDNLTLKEWLNFDYLNYKQEVIKFIESDEFKELAGATNKDYALGKLTPKQINLLKQIMKDNFENNGTINQIAEDLRSLKLKDRFIITDAGRKKLVLTKDQRRFAIARSESTRVAAEGVLNNYQSKGIEKVRFLASISQRTCEICLGLNGQIFELNESRGVIPVHSACRCAWLSITE